MLDTIIGALVVAGVTALAVIAYRHHRAFGKVLPYIKIGSTLGFIALSIWDFGVGAASLEAYQVLDEEHATRLDAELEKMRFLGWKVFAVFLFWMTYLQILGSLPDWLGLEEERIP